MKHLTRRQFLKLTGAAAGDADPRGCADMPELGIFAQRAKQRSPLEAFLTQSTKR